jgi:NO-binding membrane sensor protein with MHYT domain
VLPTPAVGIATMPEGDLLSGGALHSHHDPGLVVLAIAVAILASFVALDLAGRIRETRAGSRIGWWLAGAVAMGGGIWSMHFIAMLAYNLPIPVHYDVMITVASLIAAIAVTGIGLYIVTAGNLGVFRLCAAGIFVGVGVCIMHYTGMAAMRLDGELIYDPNIVGLSFAVAIVVATVGLFLLVTMRGDLQRIVSALVIAFAVSGMHYTAMYGTTCRSNVLVSGQEAISIGISPMLLGVCIAGATMVILVVSQLMSFFQMLKETEVRN